MGIGYIMGHHALQIMNRPGLSPIDGICRPAVVPALLTVSRFPEKVHVCIIIFPIHDIFSLIN